MTNLEGLVREEGSAGVQHDSEHGGRDPSVERQHALLSLDLLHHTPDTPVLSSTTKKKSGFVGIKYFLCLLFTHFSSIFRIRLKLQIMFNLREKNGLAVLL